MTPACRPDAGVVLDKPADIASDLGPYSSRRTRASINGPEGWRMAWHIWLFRFLLACNVVLLTALIVMVLG